MQNVIIYLVGYPATGKLTIAKEIVQQGPFRLVDNHLINNPIFSLIRTDGAMKMPPRVWDNIKKIWEAVLDTLAHIAAPENNYILTNALGDTPEEQGWFSRVEEMAKTRGAAFIPVKLVCEETELLRRIALPDREKNMKWTNPAGLKDYIARTKILSITHPNMLELDVTNIQPSEAARLILQHAQTKS